MRLIPFTQHQKFDIDPKPAWGAKDGRVFFRCECGVIFYLDKWSIADDGTVTPSVDHSASSDCPFHEHVKLDNYSELTQVAVSLQKMYRLIIREEPYCLVCGEEVKKLLLVGRSVYAKPCNHRQYQADRIPSMWQEKE